MTTFIADLPKSCFNFCVKLDILDCNLDNLALESSNSLRMRSASEANDKKKENISSNYWPVRGKRITRIIPDLSIGVLNRLTA